MTKFRWIVYWSCGPYDNPDDGEVSIYASTIEEVIEIFNIQNGDCFNCPVIDGIMRADLID